MSKVETVKNRKKMTKIEGFVRSLPDMNESSFNASGEKKKAIEEYRWMIEELKLSLFAQELRTPFPVSGKRLEEKRKEIERMI